jgi:hypothetical protein
VGVAGDEGGRPSQLDAVQRRLQRLLERTAAGLRVQLHAAQFELGRRLAPGRHGPLQLAAAADYIFIRQISPPSG